MDLVTNCKDKLVYFRIKELKDVLTQLGLSKQGKKQDLVDRILAIISDEQVPMMWPKKMAVEKEEVANLIDDIYRKIRVSGAPDFETKGQSLGFPDGSKTIPKEEIDDSIKKIRCPCGVTLDTEAIVQCDDPKCRIWQHIGCVVLPEKPTDGLPQIPDPFYCEICRLSRADPFWVTIGHPLYPVKLNASNVPTDGTNPLQRVEKTFQLSRTDKDLFSKHEYNVQVWCVLLNDKVPFRMQWPQYAELQVNGVSVRVINRPGSQLLGANGRDDGPVITAYTKDGINKITLAGCDVRVFCLGVRIVKRRTVQQILNLIPKESDGERFDDALARVCRCIGGGTTTDNADSDSDLEVVADSFTVNLRCPMSGSRIKVAGRFEHCAHMGCFDLDTFVELNQRSRKWQCPICLKNYALENIIIDPYFNRITSMMRNCGEDVTEIQIKPDGSWRLKLGTVGGELERWHLPEGGLCPSTGDVEKQKMEISDQIKQEGVSEGHTSLKIGIRKNCNGFWEVRPDYNNLSSGNILQNRHESNGQKFFPMSGSATGSGRDGEDASVNQDGGGNFDSSANNGIELDSVPPNIDTMSRLPVQNLPAPVENAQVIVLSDSDEENDMLSSRNVFGNDLSNTGGVNFSIPPGVSDPYAEHPILVSGANSCLGLFNTNDDEFGQLWSLTHCAQVGPGFQLFGSEADASDALVNLQQGAVSCPTSMSGYTLAPETTVASSILVPNSSIDHSNSDMNDRLVDNPLAFGGDDPSLQIFLPTRPSDATAQSDFRDQADISSSIHSEDWISLTLGGSGSGGYGDSDVANGLNSRQPLPTRDRSMKSSADTASLFLGMDDGGIEQANKQRSGSPFSFPRQRRSVRPRLDLSLDSRF